MQSLLLVRNVSDMAGVSEEHVSILTSCLLKRVHVIRAMQSKHIHSFRVVQTRQADSHSFLAASSFGAQNSDIWQLQRTWRVSISYLHDCMLCESLWYVNIYMYAHVNIAIGHLHRRRCMEIHWNTENSANGCTKVWAPWHWWHFGRPCCTGDAGTGLQRLLRISSVSIWFIFGFTVSAWLHFLHLTSFDIPDQSWSTTSPDNIICRWCEQHLDCI